MNGIKSILEQKASYEAQGCTLRRVYLNGPTVRRLLAEVVDDAIADIHPVSVPGAGYCLMVDGIEVHARADFGPGEYSMEWDEMPVGRGEDVRYLETPTVLTDGSEDE